MNWMYDILEIKGVYRRRRIREWLAGHRYCQALWYLAFFLPAFFLTERMVTPKYIISCPLDAAIPFHETFIVLYLFWFVLLPASWLYTAVVSKEDLQDLCLIMFGGMTVAIISYWLWPNGVDLRPGIVGDGICGRLVSWIHAMDTPGNVCPSIHVSSSLSVAVVACRSRAWKGKIWQKLGVCLAVCGICLSTMFLKQHSVVDVFCGALVTALLAVPVYGLPWRRWLRGSRMEFFL